MNQFALWSQGARRPVRETLKSDLLRPLKRGYRVKHEPEKEIRMPAQGYPAGYRKNRPWLFAWSVAVMFVCASDAMAFSPTSNSDKEKTVMTTPVKSDPAQSAITAKEALQRLLGLLRESKSIQDFTPDFIGKGMGVKVTVVDQDTYGYGAKLSRDWGWGITRQHSRVTGPRIDFGFSSDPGSNPQATEICEIDYTRFTSELEAIGFARKANHGQHGIVLSEDFDRPNLHVQVLAQAEHPQTQDGVVNRSCVKTVIIQ